ncbi:MAG TPA: thioesterase family protein [Pyrinomonadaceae bacterium]|jgi:acyl-CoA thioester hydrolase
MIAARLEFAIRPYDVDVAGIVSNIVYVRWLEDLRMELLRSHFRVGELLERNLMPVLVRTEINYRASLRFTDECTGRMTVVEVGRTSATMHATFHNADDAIVAEAKQVGVFIDSRTGKPVPLPGEFLALYRKAEPGDEV